MGIRLQLGNVNGNGEEWEFTAWEWEGMHESVKIHFRSSLRRSDRFPPIFLPSFGTDFRQGIVAQSAASRVWRARMRQRAKFRLNRRNGCGDMAI